MNTNFATPNQQRTHLSRMATGLLCLPLFAGALALGCSNVERAAEDGSTAVKAKAAMQLGEMNSDATKTAEVVSPPEPVDIEELKTPQWDAKATAVKGSNKFEAEHVTKAVLECMRSCGDLGDVSDEIRTCELRCANSARSPQFNDDCTVACTTEMYTCRAECSQDVERDTDVATCGLNCAEAAKLCLQDKCGQSS